MAQSYDVYFARMLLTLGLVEREKLQGLLRSFQQLPTPGKPFSRYLVEQKVLDADTVKQVGSDLERYLLERRSKQRALEPRATGAVPVAAPHRENTPRPKTTSSLGRSSAVHDALDPDEISPTPLAPVPVMHAPLPPPPPPLPSSPPLPPPLPPRIAPGDKRPLRAPSDEAPIAPRTLSPRSSEEVARARASSDELPIARPRTPSEEAPISRSDLGRVPAGSGSSAERRAPPSSKPGRESQRLKKSTDGAESLTPTTPALDKPALDKPEAKESAPPARESQRIKRSTSDVSPGRESQRLKKSGTSDRLKRSTSDRHKKASPEKPSERAPERAAESPASTSASAAAANADQARQRALFDRATKDPLAKLVGRRLGRTEITKLVETGQHVTVFDGKHGDDERPALVKVLRPDRVKDRAAIERFSREAKVLEKIDHPNIARVFETGEGEKVRFLSIEASTGEVLSGLLERVGRLPPERIQKIGRATALGLAAAHRAGVIHRDVRPANIYIEEDGTVKISGFGLARDVEVPGRLTATGQITGHPAYVAPEVAQAGTGEEVSGKADVYSLGIVLFLALVGRLPFESRSVVKLVGMQMNKPAPPVLSVAPGTPPKLAAAVDKLLTKAPAKRPDAMEAATLLGAKDLLDGATDASRAAAGEAPQIDDEEALRRMLAPDEAENLSDDEPTSGPISGPSCAACELPLGARATSLHGNTICERCLERVEGLDICAACFQELSASEQGANDAAVFAGHVYCRACTARVKLPCGQCGKPVGLVDLTSGKAKAKGEQLVHASCPS